MSDVNASTPTPAAAASAPPPLTYTGPGEVLLNQAITLSGGYDAKRIAQLTLLAEDKFPLTVTPNPAAGTWQVKLDRGFSTAGSRWLRLRGADSAGKLVGDRVIYITVSTDPLTVGKALVLKVLQDTLFKVRPVDSSRLNDQQKVLVKAGQTFNVNRYGVVDGHLKLELAQAIPPIGNFGYFYEDFVQLSKGTEVLRFEVEDIPDIPLAAAEMLVTATTLLKAKPTDSSTLPANQKVELLQGQTIGIQGYAIVNGHFRVSLSKPIQGFGDRGFVYWQFVTIKRNGREIEYDPDALSVTALKPTLFKKRPVDSSALNDREKFSFPAGAYYGVSGYALESGHIKVSLTEELPNFGNTGYLFPDFVRMRRGSRTFNPFPPQVEIGVPYFSQRDNPRNYWSTCNVTSIAMVFYRYGIRPKRGGQLEDELLQWCLSRYGEGSQTDNNVLSELIKAYGFKTSFSTTRKWADVKTELANNRPVILGGMFTASGHIVVLIGYTGQGYIVNDPWGNALSGYSNTEGRKRLYPYDYMDRVAGPDGNVWAHFISR